ncbi:MAG: ketopantoate reductase family protein [Actinomycetota bacterium]
MGAGAVGGTIAARLAISGIDVLAVDPDAEHVKLLREPGLEVGGLDGGRVTKLNVFTPDELRPAETPDVVLLAVRSRATAKALDTVVPHLGETSDVVSLQNGLNEDVIASVLGPERTVGCVVGIGATWIEPGRVSLDANGDLTIGRLDGSRDARLEGVRELLAHAFRTTVTTNIRGALWGKMLVNSMTVLGALGGMLTGELLVTRERRRLVAEIVAEGVDVATAEGVDLPDVFGLVPANFVHRRARGWLATMDRVLIRVGEAYGAIKSVTWRDIELGRPTEIDAVTGEIVRRGQVNGTATPLSSSVYQMLKEIESGQRDPGSANFDVLAVATAS